MKIKDGVILAGLNICMRKAFIEADKIWKKFDQELVITSGLDGAHSAGSLHYYGLAIDVRTRYFSPNEKTLVARELKEKLGPCFDVIEHGSHIHIEYDPDNAYWRSHA